MNADFKKTLAVAGIVLMFGWILILNLDVVKAKKDVLFWHQQRNGWFRAYLTNQPSIGTLWLTNYERVLVIETNYVYATITNYPEVSFTNANVYVPDKTPWSGAVVYWTSNNVDGFTELEMRIRMKQIK